MNARYGNRIDGRARGALRETAGRTSDVAAVAHSLSAEPATFARGLGNDLAHGEPRATHRRPKRRYKKRVRMASKLDPPMALIKGWLAAEPQLTAIAIIGRLADLHPDQLGKKQHSIVQRLLRVLRRSSAQRSIADTAAEGYENLAQPPGAMEGPIRPQPLSLFQASMLIHQRTPPLGNILRCGNTGGQNCTPDNSHGAKV